MLRANFIRPIRTWSRAVFRVSDPYPGQLQPDPISAFNRLFLLIKAVFFSSDFQYNQYIVEKGGNRQFLSLILNF